jgi:hypothetical protein
VRKSLEDALGLRVTDAKGERFFQSTLVQTLFYGLFAAWVLWQRSGASAAERFDWEKAARYLHVPILRKLFRELTDPSNLDAWDNLTEVMGWAADTLNRVERGAFFERFRDAEAVQYFYEPFLEAFDPELRKQLGVWYTPPEIVKYMVARVDQVLKSDFDRPDGLADPGVYVLDPCCGTGAYLVEVLATIAATLADKGEGALVGGRLKQAATGRVFGFEILPAPFVVAHLQLGLFLAQHGAALDERHRERASVYLTNALTGWQPPVGAKRRLLFPEMEEERDAAERVKQGVPILVVLGNPPYNGFAGLPAEEEAGLVEPYRTTHRAPRPQGQGLNDLYVRFFRVAERCITERHAQHGIVCYISNYSWLDGLSHTGLRERFLEEFDAVWIDSLNGDKYKTGKTTPEGNPDPSVFSTPHNREGIQVGTAVALLARRPRHVGPAQIHFRDFWGERKREELLASGEHFRPDEYTAVQPVTALGLPFRPMATAEDYTAWPLMPEVFPFSFPGVQSKQDQLVVDIDRARLLDRIRDFFDPRTSNQEMAERHSGSMDGHSSCEATSVRAALIRRGIKEEYIRPFLYKAFDPRWIYWEPETSLLGRKSPDLFANVVPGNIFIEARRKEPLDFWSRGTVTPLLADNFGNGFSNFFPMLVVRESLGALLGAQGHFEDYAVGSHFANASTGSLAYLNTLNGVTDAPHLFHHAIAVMHAPEYAAENAAALRQDWPRIPLPATREDLLASAELGRKVAALLDPETPVEGVTAGKLRPELRAIGVATRIGGGQLGGADFAVNARWGISGKGGVTMPGPGRKTERALSAAEAAALGEPGARLLGPDTLDVYWNEGASWQNVPRRVWEYTLGGYQVLKKWLSYREEPILGRPLSVDEVAYFSQVARRIAALVLLAPELDANYRRVKSAAYEWPR